jgi:hypothetical protein
LPEPPSRDRKSQVTPPGNAQIARERDPRPPPSAARRSLRSSVSAIAPPQHHVLEQDLLLARIVAQVLEFPDAAAQNARASRRERRRSGHRRVTQFRQHATVNATSSW